MLGERIPRSKENIQFLPRQKYKASLFLISISSLHLCSGPTPFCHGPAIFFAAGDIKKTHRPISRQATWSLLQTTGAPSLNCWRGPRDELRPASAVNRFYGRRLRIYCNWTQFRRLVYLKWPAEYPETNKMTRRMAATAQTIPHLFYVVVIFAIFLFRFCNLATTAERLDRVVSIGNRVSWC